MTHPVPVLQTARPRYSRAVRRRTIAVLAFYLLLAATSVWPLPLRMNRSIALGTETAATVPLLNTWTVWWNSDRLLHGLQGYWDAPIFFPCRDTLAFSEPMPTTGLVAPVIWCTGNRVLANNLFLVLALALNGWAAYGLLAGVGIERAAALAGGSLMIFLPLVHHELGVLQLVPLCGILWTIHGLHRLSECQRWLDAVAFGTAFGFTYATCAYYGLFLSVLLLLAAGWILRNRLLRFRVWAKLTLAIATAACLIAPIAAVQYRVATEHELERPEELVAQLSAKAMDYTVAPWPSWLSGRTAESQRQRGTDQPLCPGYIALALAFTGAACGLGSRGRRAWTAFCLTVLVLAFLLSMGPQLRLFGWSPYVSLMRGYPGFAQVRSAYRFAIFVQIASVLLAAQGIEQLVNWSRRAGQRRFPQMNAPRYGRWPGAFVAGVTVIGVLECWSPGLPSYTPPDYRTQRAWIEWLRTQTTENAVLAHLPLPTNGDVASYQPTALWMYWNTYHHRRLINGYSGFLPARYVETMEESKGFPDAASVQALRQIGVGFCVIERAWMSPRDIAEDPVARRHLVWEFGDDAAGLDIYRLR